MGECMRQREESGEIPGLVWGRFGGDLIFSSFLARDLLIMSYVRTMRYTTPPGKFFRATTKHAPHSPSFTRHSSLVTPQCLTFKPEPTSHPSKQRTYKQKCPKLSASEIVRLEKI